MSRPHPHTHASAFLDQAMDLAAARWAHHVARQRRVDSIVVLVVLLLCALLLSGTREARRAR